MHTYNTSLITRARTMRKQMTLAEKQLWFNCLHSSGFKFRKQRPFGDYILDFYCAELKLVIEVDGESHFDEQSIIYDKARTVFLESTGLTVLRFTNTEVFHELDAVKRKLDLFLRHPRL